MQNSGGKMKVVAFNGSPRRDGNTFQLLKKVLEPIKEAGIETTIVQVGGTNIKGCIACYKCMENKDKKCIINNDIANSCIEQMLEADAIIFGTPTYFANMSAETKALIDRAGLVAFANDGLFARKIGAGVVAARKGGGAKVLGDINYMFLMSQMIVPGSTYWNFGIGMDKGDVQQDTEALANMKNLGENIAWLINCTKDKKDIN